MMTKKIKNKKYKLTSSKYLEFGDMYWTPITNSIEIYKNIDYGVFDPKKKEFFYKIELIK